MVHVAKGAIRNHQLAQGLREMGYVLEKSKVYHVGCIWKIRRENKRVQMQINVCSYKTDHDYPKRQS